MTSTRTKNANRHACIHENYPHFGQVDQCDYREELEDVIESLSTPPSPTFPSSPTSTLHKRLASQYRLKDPLGMSSIIARGEAEAWVRGIGGWGGQARQWGW